MDSARSSSQFAPRTATTSSIRTPTLSTSLLFARQRSSDSSVLSSLLGDGQSAMAEATGGDATIYPDTINPAFQAGSAATAPPKTPPAASVARDGLPAESPLFADLSSDYAMNAEEYTLMPPNQTLDQMLAQDSQGTQQLLPLQQRQEPALKVNDLAPAEAQRTPTPPPAPAKEQAAQTPPKRQSEDSLDDGSEDWDVVGSDQEDAETAHAAHVALSPVPGGAAYRMSASGRVDSSSTRHLSSAGGGVSQYDEFSSADRVPRFVTGEPQYTYGDGGGPPPADCKFYIAVMVNLDDVIESDSLRRRRSASVEATPRETNANEQDIDDDEDDSDTTTTDSDSDSSDDSDGASPTPKVALPSPMQHRTRRAPAQNISTTSIASGTISTLASVPGGATLETSFDVATSVSGASRLLASNASSGGTSSSLPPRDMNVCTAAAQLNTPPRIPAAESSERRRQPLTWDQSTLGGIGHTTAPSPLRSTASAGAPRPRARNEARASSGGRSTQFRWPVSGSSLPSTSDSAGPSRGRQSTSVGPPPPPSRASFSVGFREHRPVHADAPGHRSFNSALLPGHDRAASVERLPDDRIRHQASSSAHSASLGSVQTPDSGMSMPGSDTVPVHVMEPGHWSQAEQQHGHRHVHAEDFSPGIVRPRASFSSRTDESFVSSAAGLVDLRSSANLPYSSLQQADSRHAAYPGKKVERWQELPRQAQLVQKQIKREMQLLGSLQGDPLAQFQFHIPLFAAMWGTVREAAVVPCLFTRAYKEVLGAAVSRGNLSRFASHNSNDMGGVGMRDTWRKRTLSHLPGCPERFKAVLLWFRDATHIQFFREPESEPAPFTEEEAAEVIAVSFMNNLLNRMTLAQVSDNESLPGMGVFRPLMQMLPSFQSALYKSVYKSSKEAALPGISAEVRPQTRHSLGTSFKWAAPLPHIADALSYLEGVVNYHLRGRFLPLDLCDKFKMWMDEQYTGVYHSNVQTDEWLRCAAQDAYPDDPQRQDAMLYMLLIACNPLKAGGKMNKTLRSRGWRQSQIQAMAPFAAFHAARITSLWQATVPCVSKVEATNDSLWSVKIPDGELW